MSGGWVGAARFSRPSARESWPPMRPTVEGDGDGHPRKIEFRPTGPRWRMSYADTWEKKNFTRPKTGRTVTRPEPHAVTVLLHASAEIVWLRTRGSQCVALDGRSTPIERDHEVKADPATYSKTRVRQKKEIKVIFIFSTHREEPSRDDTCRSNGGVVFQVWTSRRNIRSRCIWSTGNEKNIYITIIFCIHDTVHLMDWKKSEKIYIQISFLYI